MKIDLNQFIYSSYGEKINFSENKEMQLKHVIIHCLNGIANLNCIDFCHLTLFDYFNSKFIKSLNKKEQYLNLNTLQQDYLKHIIINDDKLAIAIKSYALGILRGNNG
jgi:hypothetical protein